MGVRSQSRASFVMCLLLVLVATASICVAVDDTTSFHVVGYGECADCLQNNHKISEAFPGLLVSIDCKIANEGDMMERVATGELDENGSFLVELPKQVVDESGKKLKQDCFAQLHSSAAAPCPIHEGIEAAKIVLKTIENGKLMFGPAKKLKFSTALCTSKLLWPVFNYPPLPKLPWKKASYPKKPFIELGHPLWFHHPFLKKHKHFSKHHSIGKKEHSHSPVVKKEAPVVVPPVVKKPAPVVVKEHHKPEIVPIKKPVPFFEHPFHKKPHPLFKKPFPWFKKPLPLFNKPKPFFKPPIEKPFFPVIPHA